MADKDVKTVYEAVDRLEIGGIAGIIKLGDFCKYFCLEFTIPAMGKDIEKGFKDLGEFLGPQLSEYLEKNQMEDTGMTDHKKKKKTKKKKTTTRVTTKKLSVSSY